jgi:hypothetical protein
VDCGGAYSAHKNVQKHYQEHFIEAQVSLLCIPVCEPKSTRIDNEHGNQIVLDREKRAYRNYERPELAQTLSAEGGLAGNAGTRIELDENLALMEPKYDHR